MAWSQRTASIVSIFIVAGMCITVLLTSGRAVGAEQAVVGTLDSAGTRAIIVRADPDAGLTTEVLDRLAVLEGIEWAGAFSTATDVTNAAFPGGTRVAIRHAWGTDLAALGFPERSALPSGSAFASTRALEQLGMPQPVGGVETNHGQDYAVVGEIAVPEYLSFLEPMLVVPEVLPTRTADQTVGVLVVIAKSPELVSPVSESVESLLGVEDPTKIRISVSQTLADLQASVQSQLGTFGRNLVLVVLGITAVLVAVILYGLVMLRRKDFGRRRALGATRSLIVGLLLIQMAILATIGAVLGSIAAAVALAISGDPAPSIDYYVALGTLAVVVAVAASLLPALAASRRDPIRELRVP